LVTRSGAAAGMRHWVETGQGRRQGKAAGQGGRAGQGVGLSDASGLEAVGR
jgi:hypothetical protein